MIFFYWLVAILPMNQNPLWTRGIGGLTIFKCIGGLCVIAAIFHVAAGHRFPPLLRNWTGRWFLLYILVQLVSYIARGGVMTLAPGVLSNLISILFLFVITSVMVDSLPRFRWVVLISIGSVAYNSLHAIQQWLQFHNVYAGFRTYGGLSGDPNYYTVSTMLWVPVCFCLMRRSRARWERFGYIGCLVVSLIGIIMAGSRGGFLGLVAAVLFLAARGGPRLRRVILVGLLLAPLCLLIPGSPLGRLMNPSRGDQESAESRVALAKIAWDSFREHPVAGVGMGELWAKLKRGGGFNVTHNTYLEVAAQLGLLGLVPFIGTLVCAFRALGRTARGSFGPGTRFVRQAALGMQAGLISFAVGVFFISDWWERMFWLVIFLATLMPRVKWTTLEQEVPVTNVAPLATPALNWVGDEHGGLS